MAPAISSIERKKIPCAIAAAAEGKTEGSPFVLTTSYDPRGCFYATSNNYAYFNPHTVGAGMSDFQLLGYNSYDIPDK